MNNTDPFTTELAQLQQKMQVYLQTHWRLFLFEGIAFMLLGLCAVIIPQFSSVFIVIFLGWIIIFGGVIHAGRALFFPDIPGFGLWLTLGVLQIVVGYLLIADPIAGVMTLTMMMTLFFVCEGIIKVYLAFMMKPLPHWHFVLFSGATALLFALIILTNWSQVAHWLLGLFIGVNMMILGWSMVKMGLHYKEEH
jgi:uncharacterized membrane protein HdeD (DUF308 family)